jgi:hypothetical protein
MTPTPSRSATRWQFIGLILMSVALGGGLLTALEKWLRGESIVWYLVLPVLFVLAISMNAVALMKRIS